MMNDTVLSPAPCARRALLHVAAGLFVGAAAVTPAAAHDYPTVDRVNYVHECISQHPGPRYEMVSKCSCVLDKIASAVPFDEFETMLTATNATSIGGERGNAIRDAESMQVQIRRYRELQATAKKSCFISVDAK